MINTRLELRSYKKCMYEGLKTLSIFLSLITLISSQYLCNQESSSAHLCIGHSYLHQHYQCNHSVHYLHCTPGLLNQRHRRYMLEITKQQSSTIYELLDYLNGYGSIDIEVSMYSTNLDNLEIPSAQLHIEYNHLQQHCQYMYKVQWSSHKHYQQNHQDCIDILMKNIRFRILTIPQFG